MMWRALALGVLLLGEVAGRKGMKDFPHADEHHPMDKVAASRGRMAVREEHILKHGRLSTREAAVTETTARTCKADEIMNPNPLTDPFTLKSSKDNGTITNVGSESGGHNLTFCNSSLVNYPVLRPSNRQPEELDAQAKKFWDAAEKVLRRFDCRDFYPYLSCDQCKNAYKRWICGTMFPMACDGGSDARKLCKDVCYEVVRKCPVELEFHCPTDDVAYGDPNGKNGAQTCNPVGLDLSSAGSTRAAWPLLVLACLALLLVW